MTSLHPHGMYVLHEMCVCHLVEIYIICHLVEPDPEEERTEGVPKTKTKPFC